MKHTMKHTTQPFGVLVVSWNGEKSATALPPETPLAATACLRAHLDDKLSGYVYELHTEEENGHSDWATIITSDHLEGITPDSSEADLIAACDDCVAVWESVGFFVEFVEFI